MVQRDLTLLIAIVLATGAQSLCGQTPRPALVQRQAPCQVQYARAVETIGLARWSAPESERPSIERLLNAAAKAKELVDSSFLQWEAPLCSTETLGELHTSIQTIESNGWLPADPDQRREAEAAAANAELLKAINEGTGLSRPMANSAKATDPGSRRHFSSTGRGLPN